MEEPLKWKQIASPSYPPKKSDVVKVTQAICKLHKTQEQEKASEKEREDEVKKKQTIKNQMLRKEKRRIKKKKKTQ